MKKFLLLGLLACALHIAKGQSPFGQQTKWLSGYQNDLQGETLTYHSAYPDFVNQSLLTRATDGRKTIEWETAPVPANTKDKYVYFRWLASHSTGTNSGNRHFDLYLNGEKVVTITTEQGNKKPTWRFSNADSTTIAFVQVRTDGANDAHGIAYLRVPLARIKPGAKQRLMLIGQAQQSNDWFMTSKYTFEEKAELAAYPFLLKNGRQAVVMNVLHFGKNESLSVTIDKTQQHQFEVKDGMNSFEIAVPAVQATRNIAVVAKYADKVLFDGNLTMQPVIKREIHFIHHSHTDIGYSHLQPEVARIHTKNIRDAIRLVEKTKNYPEEAKFTWNVESLWAVENFLKEATPTEEQQFVQAVKSGRICLSALYANILTGLSMPEEIFHYTDYAEVLRKKYGIKIESAMISDVPGFAWTTVTGLSKGGVKYFSSGPNYLGNNHPYRGDRVGHFVKEWGDKPVWWQSPSGQEKVLFWTGGKGYSSWHGNAPGAIFQNGPKRIAEYLNDLAAHKYPYEMVQWRYNVVADNAPLDSTISDFVKQWNEKYASPTIVLNSADKMFEAFAARYGKDIPVVKGDITPYWEDGAASTATEEGANRVSSLQLQQITTLYSVLNPGKYNPQAFYEAWRNVLMFHEHTWGAHNSITQPGIPFVTEQWRIKKDFMLAGEQQTAALKVAVLDPLTDSSSTSIAVVNTLSWTRNGQVIFSSKAPVKSIADSKGKVYPLQQLKDGSYLFIAENLPPLSTTIYTLQNTPVKVHPSPFTITKTAISNGKVNVIWNSMNGSITTLEKDGVNYAASFREQGLNGYWYVPGMDPTQAVTNAAPEVIVEEVGPYRCVVRIQSSAPGTQKLVRVITMVANDDKVTIENMLEKSPTTTKEAMYFSFPFVQTMNKVTTDAGYGTLRYLEDQLPGSNRDFISTRRWLDASGEKRGVQLMMIEPFMMSPGMVDERLVINQQHKEWKTTAAPTAQWFSYVMNNYWHTNYKASQEGNSVFHYALRPHNGIANEEQEKAAMEFMQPLIAFPAKATLKATLPLCTLSNHHVVITSITPQPGGQLVVRLFNPLAVAQDTDLISRGNGTSSLSFQAFEVKEVVMK
ncbi:glycosyl hydrolase family 38 [Chitinophaga skermanii]|uniref:Glycosyl hydrolase family 38 n=1 Tax=Chitinophaga skermanii TaxID=331697 RepID=A0A327QV60_9BACT|nr:glycoside hydrolase [Chitinophaga skermanii]RAJ08260.1 glycosyl hydrolase family 38 [Chitinophaga skermanii]